MKSRWQAFYYDGKTAERHDAEVEITPRSLLVTVGRDVREWGHDEFSLTQGDREGQPVRIERGEEALIIKAPDFLPSLSGMASGPGKRFGAAPGGAKRRLLIPVLALAALTLGLLGYLIVIPRAASFAAAKVPPSVEDRLGAAFVRDLAGAMEECDSPGIVSAVSAITGALEEAARPHPYRFKVHIFKDETVNAFAAPGGHIVLFTGLIEATKTPEELAGVLSHEMEHVLLRHSTEGIFQDMSTGMLLTLLLGDLDGISGAARTLGNMSHSRAREEEADREGAGLLMRAGINPGGMISFFERLGGAGGGGDGTRLLKYLSTHPLTGERIDYLKGLTGPGPRGTSPLLPGVDWKEAKSACS
ncbi:MAG: M48 family metallopeptidase [Thermodesulfobacteriota bacterium]